MGQCCECLNCIIIAEHIKNFLHIIFVILCHFELPIGISTEYLAAKLSPSHDRSTSRQHIALSHNPTCMVNCTYIQKRSDTSCAVHMRVNMKTTLGVDYIGAALLGM